MNKELKIYNTLSKQKEVFIPINPPFVGLYVCGPTLYSEVHLGNMRSFTSFDMIYRYLTHLGYKVRYVRNITDAGHITNSDGNDVDRIGEAAKLQQIEPMEIVQKYTVNFHEISELFNLLPPNVEPTATGHIIEQIEMIKRIIDNGFAYEINNSVYFDVKKYNEEYNYGILSGRKVEELFEQTRALEAQNEKRYFADFALWKSVGNETIQKWNSPWGVGVPGWHIECSVMSTKYLGKEFDIHGGGMDIKFPHHECEIAQSVGADGKAPVKLWMHGNMLTVNGTKMSKSLGNSFLPMELINGSHPLLKRGFKPMVIRFFMMQTHYSSTLDFSNEALEASEKGFIRLMNAYTLMEKIEPKSKEKTIADSKIKELAEKCYIEMNNDFNTPKVIAVLFDFANLINKINDGTEKVSQKGLNLLQKTMKEFIEDILGLKAEQKNSNNSLEKVMNLILEIRKSARENKDFVTSDKIRDGLKEAGIQINDGKDGATWSL